MHFAFDLMQEVQINGTRRHGIVQDRWEATGPPAGNAIAVYLVIEPTLKTTTLYEDEISAYSSGAAAAPAESP